jgi:hypothetical protein
MNGMMKAAIWIGGLLVGSSSGAIMFFAGQPSSMPPKPTPARDEAVKPSSKSAFTISDKGAAASQAVHPSQTAIPVKEPDVNSKFNAEVFDPPSNCRTGPGSGNAVKEVLQRGDILLDQENPQTDQQGNAWYQEKYLGCWLHYTQVQFKSGVSKIDQQEQIAPTPEPEPIAKLPYNSAQKEQFLRSANDLYVAETGADPSGRGQLDEGFLRLGEEYCAEINQGSSDVKATALMVAWINIQQKRGVLSPEEKETMIPIASSAIVAANKHLCPR